MSHSQSKMNSKYLFTGNSVHNFSVNEHYITWRWTQIIYGSFFNKRVKDVLIETKSVLSVKRLEVSRTCCNFDLKSDTSNATGFILRCATRKKSGHWTIQTWNVICHPSEVDDRVSQIKLYRELANPNRPKSLLVFINPYGGKRQAEVIFYQTVRPIFDLAGIRSTVIVTSYQGHCQKYMLTEDIHSYDGVVTVGGDGLFSELLQGLLYRTRADAKLPLYEQHKPFSKELTPRLRIGLIPAGSTNTVIHSVHGTENVETAALHIALDLPRERGSHVSPSLLSRYSKMSDPPAESCAVLPMVLISVSATYWHCSMSRHRS
uniref:DAGKc domain-containing protein n=1 Tax=Mesocestoides corti TaxID=53468 RepID=A0A5K3EQ84_MESCO